MRRRVFPQMRVDENLRMGAFSARARAQAGRNLDRVFCLFPRLAERRAQRAGTLSGGRMDLEGAAGDLAGRDEIRKAYLGA